MRSGILYIVATPIGNLADISERALETLHAADAVLCEDTRVTRNLLVHYDISTPTESYHAQSGDVKREKILGWLRDGKTLTLVSDSGTPGISDPGTKLVSAVRRKHPNVSVIPIPGPSAVTTALSVSGLPASTFTFLGFLPHKKGRETLFNEIAESDRTVVFYESPHRILKTLASLAGRLDKNRPVFIAREMSKAYEEYRLGNASELHAEYEADPERVRGEFVCVVAPRGFKIS